MIAAIHRDRPQIATDLAVQRGNLIRTGITEQRDQSLLRPLHNIRHLYEGTLRQAFRHRLACRDEVCILLLPEMQSDQRGTADHQQPDKIDHE